jgi:hypothetical protein
VDSRSEARARAQVSDAVAGAASPRPPTVLAAAVVEALQSVGILLATVLAGIDAASGRSYHVNSGIALTIIGAGTVVALGWIAYGLASCRPWSRTPALLTQLFTGIIGIYLVQGHRYDWGGGALVLAVAGFATLLAPPSLRALTRGHPGEPSRPPR